MTAIGLDLYTLTFWEGQQQSSIVAFFSSNGSLRFGYEAMMTKRNADLYREAPFWRDGPDTAPIHASVNPDNTHSGGCGERQDSCSCQAFVKSDQMLCLCQPSTSDIQTAPVPCRFRATCFRQRGGQRPACYRRGTSALDFGYLGPVSVTLSTSNACA